MTLTTAPGTGVLNLISNPPGASVFIDTVEYNPTPVTVNNIPVGSHDFVLKLEGYDDFTDTAMIIEDKMCCETIDLVGKSSGIVCNPTPIEIKEAVVTPPVTPPTTSTEISNGEYVIIGIVIGVALVLAVQHLQKEKK
jgi:hypothetical protein